MAPKTGKAKPHKAKTEKKKKEEKGVHSFQSFQLISFLFGYYYCKNTNKFWSVMFCLLYMFLISEIQLKISNKLIAGTKLLC